MGGVISDIATAFTARDAAGVVTAANDRSIAELGRQNNFENLAAGDSLIRGATAAANAQMRGSATQAAQRVGYANSGVDESVGTPSQVAGSTGVFANFDAQTAQNNAIREALGHKEVIARNTFQQGQLAAASKANYDAEMTKGNLALAKAPLDLFSAGTFLGG